MFGDGHQHFTSHVPALLRSGSLVLDVNSGSTLLDEHFRELHNRSQASVTGVGISNDGTEVVDNRSFGELSISQVGASFVLFAIMEELGHEQLLNLVGYRV